MAARPIAIRRPLDLSPTSCLADRACALRVRFCRPRATECGIPADALSERTGRTVRSCNSVRAGRRGQRYPILYHNVSSGRSDMENFKTLGRGNSRDTSDTSSADSLPLEAMSMDLDQDVVALPAEAPPWDGINVRIWENAL